MAKMWSDKVTEAQRAAADRFDAKTYKKILFTLRIKEDADILEDIEAAQAEGISLRGWLRNLFEKAKQLRERIGAIMKSVIFRLPTGFIGADIEEEFEFEDDDDIEAEFESWVNDVIEDMRCAAEWTLLAQDRKDRCIMGKLQAIAASIIIITWICLDGITTMLIGQRDRGGSNPASFLCKIA